jgi:hypothetical protein
LLIIDNASGHPGILSYIFKNMKEGLLFSRNLYQALKRTGKAKGASGNIGMS